MNSVIISIAYVVAAVCMQEPSPSTSRGFDPQAFSLLAPLHDEAIRSFLDLSDDQHLAVKSILSSWTDVFKEYSQRPRNERDFDSLKTELANHETEIRQALTKNQQDRLLRVRVATQAMDLFRRIRQENYRDELSIDEVQAASINRLFLSFMTDTDKELREPKYQGLRIVEQVILVDPFVVSWESSARRQIIDEFTPAQKARFEEIELQWEAGVRGAEVFTIPTISRGLEITDAQLSEIKEIAKRARTPNERGFAPSRDSYSQAARLLSDQQWGRWRAMLGKPFGFSERLFER